MRITPTAELNSRFRKLQERMVEVDMDGVLILQNADLFYFTGSIQQGALYIPQRGEPIYMVRKDFGRARMESGLKEIVAFGSPKDIPKVLADFGYPQPKTVGMELDVVPVALYQRFAKVLAGVEIVDATHIIRLVRAVKSKYELEIMKDAAVMVDKMYKRAQEVARIGMTDLELSAEIEFLARKEGHQGISRMRGFNSELFFGHLFSGPDGAAPAYLDAPLGGIGVNPSIGQGASYKPIRENQPIVVDFLGAFDGYMVDQTRIMCIGELPDQLKRAYDDMLKIQARLKEVARPGVMWGDVYNECYTLACDLGYADYFMGSRGAQVSFIGHGIGVEVDEYPFLAKGFKDLPLEENMTFAFEPKAVFPGLGAVGIENTFYLTKTGLIHLTFSKEELCVLNKAV